MYNLKDFEQYTGQDVAGKAVLCWETHDKHAGRSDASTA